MGSRENHAHDQVAVVMVPLPAQGHLNQLLHLSRLILTYEIPVHYIGSATHNRQAKLRVHGLDTSAISNIHFHDCEMPPFLSPSPNPNSQNKFPSHLQPLFNSTVHLRSPVSSLLRSLSSKFRRLIVIYDSLMASVVQDVDSIPNAESYIFHSVSVFTIALYAFERMENPLDEKTSPLIPQNIPSLDDCFTNEFFNFILYQYEFHNLNSGRLYNTCRIIEKPYIELLEEIDDKQKHWAMGPFNPVRLSDDQKIPYKSRHFCLEWLDKQDPRSVIYLSFGTTTAMEDEQIKELATGLEKSRQKFIWVLRDADKGDVFNSSGVRKASLPKGFEERVGKMGIVIRDWAPQLEILSHTSTGGFMSHCGWNSCMESITMGVPIAAWPMHSDQPRNAVLMTELLRVGIVVRDWKLRGQLVRSMTVENAVKKLIASKEGDEVRKRAAEMGVSVRQAAGDGGISRLELESFVAHITR